MFYIVGTLQVTNTAGGVAQTWLAKPGIVSLTLNPSIQRKRAEADWL